MRRARDLPGAGEILRPFAGLTVQKMQNGGGVLIVLPVLLVPVVLPVPATRTILTV